MDWSWWVNRINWGVPLEFPPPFATGGWGEDRWGYFADLEIKGLQGKPVQRMRWIPSGSFLMGTPDDDPRGYQFERPQHRVTLTRGFWLGDTPCTQEFWTAVMGSNPSRFKDDGARRPVERVNWHDCRVFAERLTVGFEGLKFVLPTQAQWEYACRAGSYGAWCFGDDETLLKNYAWYSNNVSGKTNPVKKKEANSWGVYDVHGNVWEWCADWWDNKYEISDAIDPAGSESGDRRVVRGGSWLSTARSCRSAFPYRRSPDYRYYDLGFRFAQVGGAV